MSARWYGASLFGAFLTGWAGCVWLIHACWPGLPVFVPVFIAIWAGLAAVVFAALLLPKPTSDEFEAADADEAPYDQVEMALMRAATTTLRGEL